MDNEILLSVDAEVMRLWFMFCNTSSTSDNLRAMSDLSHVVKLGGRSFEVLYSLGSAYGACFISIYWDSCFLCPDGRINSCADFILQNLYSEVSGVMGGE